MEDWEESETRKVSCTVCGHVGLEESDGFFYCQDCGARADDILLTGVADEDFVDKDGGGALYSARLSRRVTQPTSTPTPNLSQTWFRLTQEEERFLEQDEEVVTPTVETIVMNFSASGPINEDGVAGPTKPEDFGNPQTKNLSLEDYYNEVRIRYVMGLQWMINMQCEALVERLNVSPLICGVTGNIWLRYLSSSEIFDDNWADNVILDSEAQSQEKQESGDLKKVIDGDDPKSYARASVLWFRSLKKSLPLSSTLAIIFLACHVSREPVLPTDIIQWSLEGKLPYFSAHIEIERQFMHPSPACPISCSSMFRPHNASSAQNIEFMSARISDAIGLQLPPVNFYAIASRFIGELGLPLENILPHACRLYEWSSPPELWLSGNEMKLPTRVCVLSILIVSIRLLYDINGYGAWENSLSTSQNKRQSFSDLAKLENNADKCSDSPVWISNTPEEKLATIPRAEESFLDTEYILSRLQATYNNRSQPSEYMKDLRSYLQYCKDVVFAGCNQSHSAMKEEEELEEKLWDFYLNQEDSDLEEDEKWKRMKYDHFDEKQEPFEVISMERAIKKLKLEMEDDRFCYIPPRVNVKRSDYLHYARKRDDGAFAYIAHADYYILLRACASMAKVDTRVMHMGVLSFERRLIWMENRIDHCLTLTPPNLSSRA